MMPLQNVLIWYSLARALYATWFWSNTEFSS